jgi:putative endonuclease
MQTTRDKGFQKEKEAATLLEKNGYKILATNFASPFGEIDIIAKHKEFLVFIEVKFRKTLFSGTAQEAVTNTKQQKIIKTAISYMKQKAIKNTDIRFDIVALTPDNFEIIPNAFVPNESRYYV